MSLSAEQAQTSLLDRIGTGRTLDAYVVGVSFLEEGLLAAALGDGRGRVHQERKHESSVLRFGA